MADGDWSGGLPSAKYSEWTSDLELYVPMRDGVRLSTDVHLPRGADGRLPTVLVRTPYDKSQGPDVLSRVFLKRGYAVVIQSERGRYLSEGHYGHYLQGARTDGYDTVEWIVRQHWSNGRVGTVGCSSTGEHQWPMAAGNHPAHAAMIPMASGTAIGDIPGNDTRGAIYRGGIPLLGLWAWWYQDAVPTERFLLPPDSTQEQRVRLRKTYSLRPKPQVRPGGRADGDKLMHLPSGKALRELGGSLTPFDQFIGWEGPADPRWEEVELLRGRDRPRVPCVHINTWHDIGIGETVRLFKHLQDLEVPNQYLIVAPGPHCSLSRELIAHLPAAELRKWAESGGVSEVSKLPDFDASALRYGDLEAGDVRYRGVDLGYAQLFLRWFEKWLHGVENRVTEMPRVQLLVLNQGWISGERWPLPGLRMTPYFLAGDPGARLRQENGILATEAPSAAGSESFVYNPGNPVPSRGGGCCEPDAALDQRPVEARRDVLVFSTPPLAEPVTIAGPVEVVLHVSSSARDTDFIVKLVDVHPCGKAINLNDDGFRVRYRQGFDRSVPMEEGQVYRITLPNMVAGNRFLRGHRIRLDITSSCFPLYERNLNTGGNNHDEKEWVVAENTVHFGGDHPSHVLLPVLPG